jgi:hypothetical protein
LTPRLGRANDGSFVGPLVWYNAQDIDSSSATDLSDHFGLVYSDGATKQAATTFAGLA